MNFNAEIANFDQGNRESGFFSFGAILQTGGGHVLDWMENLLLLESTEFVD